MFSKNDIERYFNAEKQESLVFCIIGMGAVILSIVFLFIFKE